VSGDDAIRIVIFVLLLIVLLRVLIDMSYSRDKDLKRASLFYRLQRNCVSLNKALIEYPYSLADPPLMTLLSDVVKPIAKKELFINNKNKEKNNDTFTQ